MSKFKANKGGHAPSHLREAFTASIENNPDTWSAPRRLLGQLWNCTDCLPSSYCEILEIPQGSSYAVAARKVRDEIAPGGG